MTPEFAYSKLPNDVIANYPGFVKFIESYYEWTQTEGYSAIINNYRDLINQNAYNKKYEDRIVKNMGVDISIIENSKVKTELLYKLLDEFLETRGTITSFETLFRMMFNKQVKISFPRDSLFKLSESIYLKTSIILISGKYPLKINSSVRGLKSGTTTGIESFIPFYIANERFYVVNCNNIYDEFITGEALEISTADYSYNETHYPLIDVEIIDPGTEYKKGDIIIPSDNLFEGHFIIENVSKGQIESLEIIDPGIGYNVGDKILTVDVSHFDGFVSKVSADGVVQEVKIRNKGYNFETFPEMKIISKNGTGLKLKSYGKNIGAVTKISLAEGSIIYSNKNISYNVISNNGKNLNLKSKIATSHKNNRYINKDGFIGYNSTIIDSYTKHSHSYNIESDVPSSKYVNSVNKYSNPSGYMFNSIYSVVNRLKIDDIGVTGEFVRK